MGLLEKQNYQSVITLLESPCNDNGALLDRLRKMKPAERLEFLFELAELSLLAPAVFRKLNERGGRENLTDETVKPRFELAIRAAEDVHLLPHVGGGLRDGAWDAACAEAITHGGELTMSLYNKVVEDGGGHYPVTRTFLLDKVAAYWCQTEDEGEADRFSDFLCDTIKRWDLSGGDREKRLTNVFREHSSKCPVSRIGRTLLRLGGGPFLKHPDWKLDKQKLPHPSGVFRGLAMSWVKRMCVDPYGGDSDWQIVSLLVKFSLMVDGKPPESIERMLKEQAQMIAKAD